MDFNTLQQLFGRGINPGTAGATAVKQSVGSATPRIPRPAAPVPVGRPFNPLNPIVGPRGTSPVPNPFNLKSLVRGSLPALAAEGALMLGDRLIPGGVPSEIRGAVQGGVLGGTVAGPAGATFGILAGADLTNERGRGAGSMTGEFERGTLKLDPLEARRLYMDQVPGPVRSMDMDAPERNNQLLNRPNTTQQPARDELPALTPLQERAYQSEASRLQQQAAADPYFQQTELYRKAREQANKSGLPEDREKVEQLGLAIHAAKYGTPEQRMQQTIGRFNPLMADMPGYPTTREAFEKERPFIEPEKKARIEAMDMAAEAVNQMLNPSAVAPASPVLADQIFRPSNAMEPPGFNTSATFDLSSIGARITDMQPNLNPFVADRSGEQGFAFDKNILDEKTKAEFLRIAGMYK
jgi:hypothetical protein